MERTATRRLLPAAAAPAAALAILLGCGGDAGGPAPAAARIDYVDGAIEPILVRGQRFVVEGFGFGAATGPGVVSFPRTGGGETEAPVVDSAWTPFTITATVPDSAASGPATLTVVTASGRRLTAPVHVLPPPAFTAATLSWTAREPFPRAPAGVALAAAEFPAGTTLRATLYAAGGAEPFPSGGQLLMTPDSGVYVARAVVSGGGAIDAWVRQRDTSDAVRSHVLPVPRAFAAAAIATRYNSRLPGSALYVIGGIDASGRAQATVLGADVTADSVSRRFLFLEALPAPVAGAIAVVRRGRIYVIGGTDAQGRPQRSVFVGRIGADGHIDGWYQQPLLTGPRAYGGGVVRDGRVVAIGGVADSVPPGGGLDPAPQRLVTSDTAPLSLVSGFFTGPWGPGPAVLPEGRSQFTLLDVGNAVLAVGGMYGGAANNAAETLAADVSGDSLGPFAGPVGANQIWEQLCGAEGAGTLVGLSGVTWREAGGTPRGLVLGGIDLATRQRRACTWGF
ncbi:MAG TPA: hypothetical protein VGQ06_05170 [Gemmatimonadales bacterium]|nr:hypothetical protein [Gemmatimonadales bacterium]